MHYFIEKPTINQASLALVDGISVEDYLPTVLQKLCNHI
jgi:hypothetical protein